MPRPSNTEERRAQIVDAFLTVVTREGYARATISATARAAGLAGGLLHYHFASKHEILVALVARLTNTLTGRLEARLAEAGDEPRRRVHAVIDAFVATGDDADPRAVAAWVVIAAEALRDPEVRDLYGTAMAAHLRIVQREIAGRLRKDGAPTRNAAKIAAAVIAAIEGSFHLAVAAPGLLPVGFASPTLKRMVDVLLEAEGRVRPSRERELRR